MENITNKIYCRERTVLKWVEFPFWYKISRQRVLSVVGRTVYYSTNIQNLLFHSLSELVKTQDPTPLSQTYLTQEPIEGTLSESPSLDSKNFIQKVRIMFPIKRYYTRVI